MNLNPFRKAAPADADPSTPPAPAGAKTDAKPDPRPEAPAQPASPPPKTPLSGMTDQMRAQQAGAAPSATDALNSQIVQAVQFSNQETAAYAASQVAVPPNMMITQASGLVAQAAANYFDGASKLAMASKSVLLKDMTEKFAKEDLKGAAEDALGILITDLLVGTAAAVAAAAGAIEGEAAHFALDKIDQSLSKYQDLLDKRGA
ncbi:hypothetical protein ACPRNU_02855 [Chromobacterium vaccinii]|uniref:hypothetical protein n=1 Tax=Chromobacterium vaccinii TaxID=1108595 RepID=UPI003C731839